MFENSEYLEHSIHMEHSTWPKFSISKILSRPLELRKSPSIDLEVFISKFIKRVYGHIEKDIKIQPGLFSICPYFYDLHFNSNEISFVFDIELTSQPSTIQNTRTGLKLFSQSSNQLTQAHVTIPV